MAWFKRVAAIIAAMVCACCTGCGQVEPHAQGKITGAAPIQEAASWQRDTSPVKLTINYGGKNLQWGRDDISRRIMDLTGVSLVLPAENQPLEVMQASGALTDLVKVTTSQEVIRLSDSGDCWALDELAAQYCPDFWEYLDPLERLNNQCGDGHVYTLKKNSRSEANYTDPAVPITPPYTLGLRQDLLNRAGESIPTSVEELEALLYRIKGRAQEMGFVSPLRLADVVETPIPGWMGIWQTIYWDEAEGKVRAPWRQRQWMGYLKMLRRWLQDGIIELPERPLPWRHDQLNAIIDPDDPNKGTYEEAQYAYYEETRGSWFATAQSKITPAHDIYSWRQGADAHESPFPYVLAEGPLRYQGEIRYRTADVDTAKSSMRIWDDGGLFISKACAQPERAILFLQFLKSPQGARLTHWGVEGLHYTVQEDGTLRYHAEYRRPAEDASGGGLASLSSSVRSKTGLGQWIFVEDSRAMGAMAASPELYYSNADLIAYRRMEIQAGMAYKDYAARGRNPALACALPDERTPELLGLYRKLDDAWHKAARDMVEAPNEEALEKAWAAMEDFMEGEGVDALEQEMTGRFLRALPRYQQAGYLEEIQTSAS